MVYDMSRNIGVERRPRQKVNGAVEKIRQMGKLNSQSELCNMTRFSVSAQGPSSLQLLWAQKSSTAVQADDLCLHVLIIVFRDLLTTSRYTPLRQPSVICTWLPLAKKFRFRLWSRIAH